MGSGYRTQRTGVEAILERVTGQGRRIDQAAGAAPIRNSAITGGQGLTVGEDGSPQVQIVADAANPTAGGTVYFNQADDPNVAGGINGVTNALSIFAPYEKGAAGGTPVGQIQLISAFPDSGLGPSITLEAYTDAGIGIYGNGVIAGNSGDSSGHVALNGFDVYQDTSSTRLMANSGSLVFPLTVAECRVRDYADSTYEPIRASAFTVSSSREVKQGITDLGWSAAGVVAKAKAYRWHYRPDQADPERVHFGPMVEDLPDELVDRTGETPGVDLHALIGVLWAAVGELTARIAVLESER